MFGTGIDENSWIPGLRRDLAEPGRRVVLPNPQQPFQDQAGYRSHRSPRPAGRGMVSSPVHHGSDPYLLEDAGVLSGCHSTSWEAPPLPSNLRASGQHYQLSAKKQHKPGRARMGAHLLSPPMGDEPFQEGQSHLEMYHYANFNFRDFAQPYRSQSQMRKTGTQLLPTSSVGPIYHPLNRI